MAQQLPATSGTAFKCQVDGKTTYSDAPCLGGAKVDTTPTRGMSKSTGSEKIGADVRREIQNEQMAEALKPIFGESSDQRATRIRRFKLAPAAWKRCYQLDGEIAAAEKAEAGAQEMELQRVQQQLFTLRRSYFDLRC